MKIAIVVQGRFHAFQLTRALVARGHDVTLMTNYPTRAVDRWGVPRSCVRSFWVHGVLQRAVEKMRLPVGDARIHRLFGRWAARRLRGGSWDAVHIWSGIAEEALNELKTTSTRTLLMRGSAHIRTQSRLLEEEEERAGVRLDRPRQGSWITAREEREYELADDVVVLSSFALDSFLEEGVPADKVRLLLLGSDLDAFRPPPEVVEARCDRILSGAPLRVLYVGALSFRKGMLDITAMLRSPGGGRFRFRLVGAVTPEVATLVKDLGSQAEVVSRQPESRLPDSYAWGDVFVFPTIEDGFPVVLAQAQAAGLPIIATENCSAPDLVSDGASGWVLPIRNPDAFIDRLVWCDENRADLAAMVRSIYDRFVPRSWDDVAEDFDRLCRGPGDPGTRALDRR